MITHGFKKEFQGCRASHVMSQRAASYLLFCVLKAEHGVIAMDVSTAKLLSYLVMEQKRISGCSRCIWKIVFWYFKASANITFI